MLSGNKTTHSWPGGGVECVVANHTQLAGRWGGVCSGDRHTTHSWPGGGVECVVAIGLHTAGREVGWSV